MEEPQISQNDIVRHLSNGKNCKQIAEEMGITETQVEWKIRGMKKRLFCKTQCQLVAEFLRRRIIE